MTSPRETSRWHTVAWVVTLALGALMLIAGLFILGQPVDAADFGNETGIVWDEYKAADPEAADYLMREARLLGWSFAVLGGVAAAMAATLLRAANRNAWAIVSFMPIAFAGTAVVFFSSGGTALGSFYALGAVAAILVVVTGLRTAPRLPG